jgi:hypothetical protein
VFVTKMRWRIERDYQDLKQEFGLGHYEGRGWRGFHHHATLSIAAYGFLMAQRLRMRSDERDKKLPRTRAACPSPGLHPTGQSSALNATFLIPLPRCVSCLDYDSCNDGIPLWQ